ncbi:hypothetical protein GGI12_000065 [Dipsacomyces acuminosporus]|nr:hypothetical protein GGI12_000065 [Dipsacomyces acuminosporus]
MRVPRFVHFSADLEHMRWFYKDDTPRHVSRDPGFDASPANKQAHEHAPTHAQTAIQLTAIRKPLPSFSPYEASPVALEAVEYASATLVGTVKVHNLAYEKSVVVRVTMDGWKSVSDISAAFVRSIAGVDGCRPGVDRFRFTIPVPAKAATLATPVTISMCVRYQVNGQEYWDNNRGSNYSFKLSATKFDQKSDGKHTKYDAKQVHRPTHTTKPGFSASGGRRASSSSSPLAAVSSADARRYMRYSEAAFATSSPTPSFMGTQEPLTMPGSPAYPASSWPSEMHSQGLQSPLVFSASPVMRIGSPLATSHVWLPSPTALLHC